MDIFFHALCGFALKTKSKWYLALLFGALPDILAMGPIIGWGFYHYTHSIFAAIIIGALLLLFRQPIELAFFYALHIVVDIFTHNSGTSSFLYPFEDPIGFNGVNWWSGPWIEIIGYLILLTIIYLRHRKNINLWILNKLLRH